MGFFSSARRKRSGPPRAPKKPKRGASIAVKKAYLERVKTHASKVAEYHRKIAEKKSLDKKIYG